MEIIQFINDVWTAVQRLTRSKPVQDVIKLSEMALFRTETIAKGWLINKLRLEELVNKAVDQRLSQQAVSN